MSACDCVRCGHHGDTDRDITVHGPYALCGGCLAELDEQWGYLSPDCAPHDYKAIFDAEYVRENTPYRHRGRR